MTPIDLNNAVAMSIDSVLGGRLALLAGAGLSMSPPSQLPSAAALAYAAKATYAAEHGTNRDPLPDGIEDQADFFFQQGQLGLYLTHYIDSHVFSAPHNAGHAAVADMLLSGAISVGVTTNVDTMIEQAGQHLLGRIGSGIDGPQMALIPGGTAPLLKIHGCWSIDYSNTVWTESQLAVNPIYDRVQTGSAWMAQQLLNRDLVILGYSTDWDYLNQIVSGALNAANPARVLMVNPLSSADLIDCAPELVAVGANAANGIFHLQATGNEFLEALRREFSRCFIRRALAQGAGSYQQAKGVAPPAASLEPPDLTNDDYWAVRRDLLGCKPGRPALRREPEADALLGMVILLLRAAGATSEGPFWNLNGMVVRVLRAAPDFLHAVQDSYSREVSPVVAPDIVVAVGAESFGLPSNIARAPTGTLVRGASTKWLTRAEAITELAL